jgi:hypothetical protein
MVGPGLAVDTVLTSPPAYYGIMYNNTGTDQPESIAPATAWAAAKTSRRVWPASAIAPTTFCTSSVPTSPRRPIVFRHDLQCQPVRKWTPERKCHWSQRMQELQAEQRRETHWHPRVRILVEKLGTVPAFLLDFGMAQSSPTMHISTFNPTRFASSAAMPKFTRSPW